MKNTTSIELVFWTHWLSYTTAFTVLFGLVMVLAPDFTSQAFGLMMFQDMETFSTLPADSAAYIQLAHAVMGSVLVGWGVLMFLLVRILMAESPQRVVCLLAASILLWYLPDTAFSLVSGFWQNALLNTGFVILYAVPLCAIWKKTHGPA